MDGNRWATQNREAMNRELHVDRLSDEFGQYQVVLTCRCGHSRTAYPRTLAAIAGWGARLTDVVARLQCSKCGMRECQARVVLQQKPRNLQDPRR